MTASKQCSVVTASDQTATNVGVIPGTPAFRAVSRGMFAVGMAAFAVLYCVQPLQPVFSREFGVSAAESSLSLSLTTGLLAPMLLVASSVSDAIGRKRLILWSIVSSAILTAAAGLAPGWGSLLTLRLLTGITLSGVQAVAMAYVGEEVAPQFVGFAMGLFVSGSSLGGLAGRLLSGFVNGALSWRIALGAIALTTLVSGVFVHLMLPPSQNFEPTPLRLRSSLRRLRTHLDVPQLLRLYAVAMLVMGSFVSVYSLIGYRLLAPPYSLDPAIVSVLFLMYLIGAMASTFAGRLADRWGRRNTLLTSIGCALSGILMTELTPLPVVVAGLAIFAVGFFGAHSTASGWVGRVATSGRAQASALYLFSFYIGSSVVASCVALVWPTGGWAGVAGCVATLLALAIAAVLLPVRRHVR